MLISENSYSDQSVRLSLSRALQAHQSVYAGCELEMLIDKGLAHHHVRLVGAGVIARIPKQSQLNLSAPDNLRYQAAGFERASRGDHVPRLVDILFPDTSLARGALLVQEIIGIAPSLPAHLGAICQAMASFHALEIPAAAQRAPLRDSSDPLTDMFVEIQRQSTYLEQANLSAISLEEIRLALHSLETLCKKPDRPQKRLISFDTHPGNFLITPDRRAILVDLEKARYSYPSFDLAHATLYTSTTWDTDTCAALTSEQIAHAYISWETAISDDIARDARAWHGSLRQAMWLWSITWCAKWRVLSLHEPDDNACAEDWSYQLSPQPLINHVRDRVDHYLSTDIVHRISTECQDLETLL